MKRNRKKTIEMTLEDLQSVFGRVVWDKTLAEYIGVDVRTLKKYAHLLGGLEISRGRFVFFENVLKEVLYAISLQKAERISKGLESLSNGKRYKESKMVQRRIEEKLQGGSAVGRGDEEKTDDPYGIWS